MTLRPYHFGFGQGVIKRRGIVSLIAPLPSDRNTQVMRIPFDLSWPAARPFKIRIADVENDQKPPKWDPRNRVLTVFLPPGMMATVEYSCYTNPEDAEVMVANQKIYHDKDHPSHVLLPIIPAGSKPCENTAVASRENPK